MSRYNRTSVPLFREPSAPDQDFAHPLRTSSSQIAPRCALFMMILRVDLIFFFVPCISLTT